VVKHELTRSVIDDEDQQRLGNVALERIPVERHGPDLDRLRGSIARPDDR
jgi:hypothetical protein